MQDTPDDPMEEPPAAEIPVEKFNLFHKVPDYLYDSCPKHWKFQIVLVDARHF